MENNLFTATAWAELVTSDFVVTKRERIEYDRFFELDGVKFDANDLYYTLEEVTGGSVTTDFTDKQTEILKKYGILISEGSQRNCYPATLGANGMEFLNMLEKKMFEKES